jgi:hypothetical protein
MGWKRCNTCNGVFNNTLPDGADYFHVCPPRRVLRVQHADGTRETILPSQLLPDDIVLRELFRPRPNFRDENTLRREGPRGEVRVIKAEGLGVTDAPTPHPDDI